jgi:hypothetical protein
LGYFYLGTLRNNVTVLYMCGHVFVSMCIFISIITATLVGVQWFSFASSGWLMMLNIFHLLSHLCVLGLLCCGHGDLHPHPLPLSDSSTSLSVRLEWLGLDPLGGFL